jgi:hypothetical protein
VLLLEKVDKAVVEMDLVVLLRLLILVQMELLTLVVAAAVVLLKVLSLMVVVDSLVEMVDLV